MATNPDWKVLAMTALGVFLVLLGVVVLILGHTSIVTPAVLKAGDKVGIVAPASNASEERLILAVELLSERGFNVVVSENILFETEYGVGDGSKQIRADAFNALARDPEIKAIFCLRGGYGSMHILPHIDYKALRKNRPAIVGYSDITAMQTAILKKARLVTFHGPMPSSNYGQDEAFDALFEILMEPKAPFTLTNIDGTAFSVLNEGVAKGRIVGGNLTLVRSLMGTPYEMDLKNKILFIEELDEAPYRLHRDLWQLRLAGKLDELAGVVIGDILPDKEYEEPDIYFHVLSDALKGLDVPIIYDVRAGHDDDPLTIPIGAMVQIEGDRVMVLEKVVH